ncbi:restriction endonuclease subunit S [Sphingobium sp. BS19]|uniref:restriction endonuclease subunit S n=1 Tax=Sphingobium sp. BS19 TaxID=3018973 RepID=UPI0022EEE3C5|nr:restriction endonuclease subunit S [Sphingobium sp. BS19]GLI96642.1 hypothetical protein Sbs19_04600 [Sphingobium sp. BS19]
MSDLGFLKKLLDGGNVEWLPLGKLGEFFRGNGLQKKDLMDEGLPAIHYGQIYTKYDLEARETYSYVAAELFRKLRKAKANDLLLATTSENDEDVVKPLAWYGANVAISGDMMLFRHRQNAKYLAHFLLTETFQKQKGKYITGTKIRRVSSGDLAKLEVPIPCPDDPEKSLAIQGEIVRILDTFTKLTAELTDELTDELAARKKQYNHYRESLFTFTPDEANFLALGDERLGEFIRGGGLQKKDFTSEGVGCIHYGQIYTHYRTYAHSTKSFVSHDFAKKARKAQKGDLVIATTSENDDDVCKAVAWLPA